MADIKRGARWRIAIVLGGLLLLSGVFPDENDPRAGKTRERVFVVDASQSRVFWRVDAHTGIIPLCEGELVMHGNTLVDARFRVCMDSLRNIDIDYDLMRSVFENTIKSKEIFHTSRFPYSYFKLCGSESSGKDSLRIAGDLVIKDIENCIRFNSYFQLMGDSIRASTDTIHIDRTDWGIFAMTEKYRTSESSFLVSDTIQFQLKLSGKLKNPN